MFLAEPEPEQAPERQALYDQDVEKLGYVMNTTRAWAWHPALVESMFGLIGAAAEQGGLSMRDRAVLTVAAATGLGDSYCALAWGRRLADAADVPTAVAVVADDEAGLTDRDRALARWARQVARDPNATTAEDVDDLRAAGLTDADIHAVTVFVAARLAFSTVNDALGATPDRELLDEVPPELAAAVTFGRFPA